ncbi:hypothetical protein AJ87_34945 [Rhizobium yanglingense]|nr:hypothetical protein AJ87_34945 [Rhizobium yanglingense]
MDGFGVARSSRRGFLTRTVAWRFCARRLLRCAGLRLLALRRALLGQYRSCILRGCGKQTNWRRAERERGDQDR